MYKKNFSIFAQPGGGSGLDKLIWAFMLNFNSTNFSAAVPADGNINSTPAQSPCTLASIF
jgi:hypothetical protein